MKDPHAIGIDLGSTFAKATLFDLEGRALSDARHNVMHALAIARVRRAVVPRPRQG